MFFKIMFLIMSSYFLPSLTFLVLAVLFVDTNVTFLLD